jgi:hypothetical protein
VRFLIGDLLLYHEGSGLADDAIAVCLDWNGTGAVPEPAGGTGGARLITPGATSPDVMT